MPPEYYATGHRKNATAKVWLQPGQGRITVNGKPLRDYLCRPTLELIVRLPLQLIDRSAEMDVRAQCLGGGIAGQAGALRHGIAKALVVMDESLRPTMRRAGLLTRDSRVKERKKYGRKRARRGFQFKKR
ncbi:MAG TPA: 30S ribosomal protein S9 [Armatimonadota bacterium]|nr:30S ribosomal protein S9 [Armatimonadota bacterium]